VVYTIANSIAGDHNKVQNLPPGTKTDGHRILDTQVMFELAMSPAMTVHVTLLLPVTTVTVLLSIVSETLMVPHTCITEHI